MKASKHLISNSHEVATAACMTEHRQRRSYAADILGEIATTFQEQPEYLTHFRELVVSALTYAQQEILWYFIHVNEVLHASPNNTLIASYNASALELLMKCDRSVVKGRLQYWLHTL